MADNETNSKSANIEPLAAARENIVPSDVDLKEYITSLDPQPYPEDVAARIKVFYKKRATNPKEYTYSKNGNLEILSKTGSKEEAIVLKAYIPYDKATLETREQNRLDAIGQAEKEYQDAFLRLQEATESYKMTGAMQPVIAAQQEMIEADQILSRVRYGTRAIQALPNPETRDVLFEQKYEVRKLFGQGNDPFDKELYRLITLNYPYYGFHGLYVDTPDVQPIDIESNLDRRPGTSELSTRQRMKDGKYARVFYEADETPNGFLSPFWPVEFTFNDTKYFTAFQAFEVARAIEAGKTELKDALLATRSVRTMRFLTKKFTALPKNAKTLWLQIFTAIYQQHPVLKEKLLASSTDSLIFADVREGPSGIGLGERDKGVLDSSKWKGENAVGTALETLRYQFREGTALENARNITPNESVISTEEQAAAKTGAIIAAKRKFAFKRPGI